MNTNVKVVFTNTWTSPVNLSLIKKEEYFSILGSAIWKLPPQLQAGMSKCQAS
jgi:hypothetical protein